MDLPATALWGLGALVAVLAALGIRSLLTLRDSRRYQRQLGQLASDALHAYLTSPRGSLEGHPPDVLYRLNALMEFERRGDPRLIPVYIALLSDPHPSVTAICRETLEELSGEKFRNEANDTEADAEAWKSWWEARKGRYAAP